MKRHRSGSRPGQLGFSMVEMLMAAFILAIGVLGLTSLQVITLRSNLGSRSHETALRIGNQILDAAASEGRLSWNNLQALDPIPLPAPVTLIVAGGAISSFHNLKGDQVASQADAVFTVTTTCTPGLAVEPTEGGRITNLSVRVEWDETPTYRRTVILTRSVKSA